MDELSDLCSVSSSQSSLPPSTPSSPSPSPSVADDSYREYVIEGCKVRLPNLLENFDLSELLSVDVWTDLLKDSDKAELMSLLPANVPVNMTLEELFTKQIFHFSNPIQEFSMKLKSGKYSKRQARKQEQLFALYQDDIHRHSSALASAFRRNLSEQHFAYARSMFLRRQVGLQQFESDNSSQDSLLDLSGQISDLSEATVVEEQDLLQNKKETPKDDEKVKELKLQGNLDWVKQSARFKDLRIHKNQLTIKMTGPRGIEEYRKQETERYRNPTVPWIYRLEDGVEVVVAPVCKKISGSGAKPREHSFLKSDRPPYLTILCIARDAAARLPDGVGTRADISQLSRDSQYLTDFISDSQLNTLIGSALDRLHYEKDPCVRYDSELKLWIYLHRDRSVEHVAWRAAEAPVKRGRPPVSAFEKQKELLPEYLEDEDVLKRRKT